MGHYGALIEAMPNNPGTQMAALVGKRILGLELDKEDQQVLRITTDGGELVWAAEGDCCSESWFYAITGVDCLLGHVVTATEDVDMGEVEDDGKSRQDIDLLYSVKITTDAPGMAQIEFRNSSNGYYGGWLQLADPERPWYAGVIAAVQFRPVVEDYTA